jgi:molecular chaperone DnaK (HSP70)
MVGGMTRMPKVLMKLKIFLVKNQIKVLILMKLLQWVQLFKLVFYKVMLKMFFLLDVTPLSLGIETLRWCIYKIN